MGESSKETKVNDNKAPIDFMTFGLRLLEINKKHETLENLI
jgi:hypothetical protein